METLRLKARDALQEMLFKKYPMLDHLSEDDVIDLTCDIADTGFGALGILEQEQDIEGTKVKVITGGIVMRKNKREVAATPIRSK